MKRSSTDLLGTGTARSGVMSGSSANVRPTGITPSGVTSENPAVGFYNIGKRESAFRGQKQQGLL